MLILSFQLRLRFSKRLFKIFVYSLSYVSQQVEFDPTVCHVSTGQENLFVLDSISNTQLYFMVTSRDLKY
jgi:hypothetical protein